MFFLGPKFISRLAIEICEIKDCLKTTDSVGAITRANK